MGNNNTHAMPSNTIVIKICPFDYKRIQELQNIPSSNYKYQIKLECESKLHHHSNQSSNTEVNTSSSLITQERNSNQKVTWPSKHAKCTSVMSIFVQSSTGSVDQIIFRDEKIIHCSRHEVNYWDVFNCHSQSVSTQIPTLDMYSFPIHFFTKLHNSKPSIFCYNSLLQTYYPGDTRVINDSSRISVPEITAPIIQLGDERIITSLNNSNIQIWDSLGREVIKTFIGHPNELIRTMYQMHDGRVITAADHSIRIWNMTKYNCLKEMNIPNGYFVDLIQLKDRRVLTCSDECIRIWTIELDEIETIKAEKKEVFASLYQLKDGRIVTGQKNRTVKIWDLITLQMVLCIIPFQHYFTDIRMNLIAQVNTHEIIVNIKDTHIMVVKIH